MVSTRRQLVASLGLTLTVVGGVAAGRATGPQAPASTRAALRTSQAAPAAEPLPGVTTATGFVGEPGTGEPCPATLAYPRTLPASVTGWTSQTCGGHLASWTLALAGPANTDTRSSASGAAAHGPSILSYLVSFPSPGGPVGWTALPDPVESAGTITRTTLADGRAARVTTHSNGYGLSRVEWITRGAYFQLLCDHGETGPDGRTGIADADLLALADSVR